MMEVQVSSAGPMETNIDPCLQKDEPVARPIKEFIELQVDPNEPS